MTTIITGTLMLMSIFSVNFTFAYWQGNVLGHSTSKGGQVDIGEWNRTKVLIHVHDNLSRTYSDFYVQIESGESLGDDFDDYFKFDSLDPLPKNHPGVDLSLYSFDGWYLDNGVAFTKNTVVNSNIDVYPSWNVDSSQFVYTLSSGMYNINKTAGFNLVGDLYIPGWRYKGREINMVGSYSYKFTNYDFGGSLTIGAGIKRIYTTTFYNATATTLTLEEGLEEIQNSSFYTLHTSGDLVFPSTILTVGQTAFQKATFDGTIDFSLATKLTTTGSHAFEGITFQGDLVIGSGFVEIKHSSFSNIPFYGALDLSNASNLESIVTSAFSGAKITSIIFPTNGKLKSFGTSSFQNTAIVMTDLYLPNTVETISAQTFSNTKFTNIYIPLSVTYIGGSAFFGSPNATFYYEGSSIPAEWAANWNWYNCPVVFNAVF